MHLVDEAIVQVCDPQSGEPLPNGQIGELVATVNHQTYPMIRFGTGDLTVIDDARCPCGRTSARALGWGGGGPVAPVLEAAIRDVMKLRGQVEVVPRGSIPDGAKKISDERKWD